jgi:hypothetical protein
MRPHVNAPTSIASRDIGAPPIISHIACDRRVALGSEFNPNRPFHDSSLGIGYSSFVLAPPLAFYSQLERYRMSLIKVADTLSGQFQVLSNPAKTRTASHGQSKSGLGVHLFAWRVFTGST